MQSKQVVNDKDQKIWVLILAPHEEAKETITEFAKKEKIHAASFVALGAFSRAVIGYFDWEKEEIHAHSDQFPGRSHHPGRRYRRG